MNPIKLAPGCETKFFLVQTHYGAIGGPRVVSTRSVPQVRAGGEVQRPCQYARCGLGQTAVRERSARVAQQANPWQVYVGPPSADLISWAFWEMKECCPTPLAPLFLIFALTTHDQLAVTV